MKINEIAIDNKELVFETLISNIAAVVAKLFLDYRHLTGNFSVAPQDVYSIDEISEIIHQLKFLLSESNESFDEDSQTVVLLTALLNYFNTGI